MRKFKVVAIICAYNEGDIIQFTIGELIRQGIDVYLMDNNSTDDTVSQAAKWLGRGLIHIERFPQDAGYPERSIKEYVWTDILNRKEEIARTLSEYDWFIHCDADEIREGPWPDKSLQEGLEFVDRQGFNAINHQTFTFVPVDDSFQPGENVRDMLRYFDPRAWYGYLIRANTWKRTEHPVNLSSAGGHSVNFPGIRTFPIRFLLLHYPLRGLTHGRRKIFVERSARYARDETDRGWHRQYNGIVAGKREILADPESESIRLFDLKAEQSKILATYSRESITLAELNGINLGHLEPTIGRQADWVSRAVSEAGKLDEARIQKYRQDFVEALNALDDLASNLDQMRSEQIEALRSPYFNEFAKIEVIRASLNHDYRIARKLNLLKGFLRLA